MRNSDFKINRKLRKATRQALSKASREREKRAKLEAQLRDLEVRNQALYRRLMGG